MQISKLITYSFAKNVGAKDRVFRMVSGLALAIIPWMIGFPLGIGIVLTIGGIAWFGTGVVSRCGAYYIFGHSTRKRSR